MPINIRVYKTNCSDSVWTESMLGLSCEQTNIAQSFMSSPWVQGLHHDQLIPHYQGFPTKNPIVM